jgi:hypothetical protein
MAQREPRLSLGIEEEYLLVDPLTRELIRSPDPGFMPTCRAALGRRGASSPACAGRWPTSRASTAWC